MTALATTDDVAVRLGRTITDEETGQLEALLDDASAAVRAYTGQEFTEGETTARVPVSRGRARLPQRPVTDVSAVEDIDGNPVAFSWYGTDVVEVGCEGGISATRFDLNAFPYRATYADVTYTHGYAEVPAVVVAVVCQVAARALGVPADSSGVQQESVQGYSYSVGPAAAAGPVGLLLAERSMLDMFKQPGGAVSLL